MKEEASLDAQIDENAEAIDEEDIFPGYTEYSSTRYCGCKIVKISPKLTFLNEWEISPGFPLAVTFIIMSSYFLCICSMLPNMETFGRGMYIPMTILVFLFQYSYIRVILDGPGYLPFYYPLPGPHSNEDEGPLLSTEMSPSGIMSTKEQLQWARNRPRPNRCIISKIARRIVIRPDHFCDWTQTWIGKRNHKFFILFNVWGFFYIMFFTVVGMAAIITVLRSGTRPLLVCIYFIYVFVAVLFAMLTGMFMCSHCSLLCENVTSWEEWNHVDPGRYSIGCIENCEDVCGSARQWYCWPCPYSPWKGVSNEEILQSYTVDYGKTEKNDE